MATGYRDDEKTVEKIKGSLILRLLKYLKPHFRNSIFALLLIFAVTGVTLLSPYFLKLTLDTFIPENNYMGLLIAAAALIILRVVSFFMTSIRVRLMSRIVNRVLIQIRQQLFDHIQTLSFSFFDGRPTGKVLVRIISDVKDLRSFFNNAISNLLPNLATIIAALVIMFSMHARLALYAMATIPLLGGAIMFLQIKLHPKWQLVRKKSATMNAYIHENFSGIRVVQSFAAQPHTQENFDGLVDEHSKSIMSAIKLADLFWPLVNICQGVCTIVVFWWGVKLYNVPGSNITVGLLVAFVGYSDMFWRPIMQLGNLYNNLITNMSSAERIFEILDINTDICNKDQAYPLPEIMGDVSFKNVTFAYEAEKHVLRNLSFDVGAGSTIALVGPTGMGKTTITSLIMRFFDVQEGQVLIDGHDISRVTLESLRSQVGLMLQDTFLFSETIRENIRYGRLDATDEEIEEAAKAVHIHDFIISLEKGYDTNVNERGTRLSAGQRQLIAFARTILSDPRILILDEATASIDTYTERMIQEGIRQVLRGRTSFIIAHRLSTIRNADRIMVIDEGGIIEQGSHDELMAKMNAYYNLFMAQFKFLM